MRDRDIGVAVYEAVRSRAAERGVTIAQQCIDSGIPQPMLYRWKAGLCPSGAWLKRLYAAGYDVVEMLGGERQDV
jgi:hypothetical protein